MSSRAAKNKEDAEASGPGLRTAPAWLRVTLSSIGDAVITTDRNGRVTFLNSTAEALTGWTHEQAVNHSLENVFHIVDEGTRQQIANPALRALREGVVIALDDDTLLVSRDGTERPIGPVDQSIAPVRDDEGNVEGVVVVFRDISERKRQEKLVRDALAYAESILATQREPFLVLDSVLRVVNGSRSFYNTFGVQKEMTEGRFLYDLGNGQWNIPKLRELLEEVLPQYHAFDGFEVEHDFEEIGHKIMLLNARRIRTPGNQSELILLAIEDVTERRRMEAVVSDSESRYRHLFQTAKDGILILDANTGKIVDSNAFMSALVGLKPVDLIGKELYEIGMFKDIEENKKAFLILQENRYIRYEHLPVQNQRGESVEVEFVANVYHENEKLVAQCNVRDISERVALEKKISQQTEALAGESRRKDEFLAMLSHELRNPLAPIRAAVHLLKLHERAGEDLVQQQAREIIERQVGNLTKLVSDLLEVSRVVSGRIHLDLKHVELKQVIQHAIESSHTLFEAHKHELVLSLCNEPVWTNADAVRLEEVLINLLENAVKYTDDGGRIEVHCERCRDHVLLRVRDNGIGINERLMPQIFELFSQAEQSLSRSSGGLGIGLSLARRLVELHGGTIVATSPPEGLEKGSEFIVRLPIVDAPLGAEVLTPIAQTSQRQGGMRVLVVDDNPDMVTMVAGTLRHMGYSVQCAYTGSEGLKSALQWRPEVVLLDIGLPELDGYEIARRLRRDPKMQGSRLIALTGYGRDTDITMAHAAGFDAHLTKPYDPAELERLMKATPKVVTPV